MQIYREDTLKTHGVAHYFFAMKASCDGFWDLRIINDQLLRNGFLT